MSCYHPGSVERLIMRKFCRSQFHKKLLINQEPLCLSQFHSSYKARVWPAIQTEATTKRNIMSTILLPILPTASRSSTMTKTRPVPTEAGLPVLTTTGASAVSTTTTTGATQPRPTVPQPKSKKYLSQRQQLLLMLTRH